MDQLAEGVSRCKIFGVGLLFLEENPVPDGIQTNKPKDKQTQNKTMSDGKKRHFAIQSGHRTCAHNYIVRSLKKWGLVNMYSCSHI